MKKIKKGLLALFGILIVYALESWVFPRFFNIRILKFLFNVDYIIYLSILVILNAGFSIYLCIRIKKILNSKKSDDIGFSKVGDEEIKEVKSEHKLILEYLIKQDSYSEYRNRLWDVVHQESPQMSELSFSKNLKEMQRLGYITQGPSAWGFVITITDKACEELSRLDR